MNDLPITLRITVLVALVLSLAFIVKPFVWAPSDAEISSGIDAEGEVVNELKPVPSLVALYPAIPVVLPDFNDGYLFNADRSFEEAELKSNSDDYSVDLVDVTYSGSLIVGEIYKGLISYSETVTVSKNNIKSTRGRVRTKKSSIKSVEKHKQLELGDVFMGYLVESIEKDRIIFKKNNEVVEKFLYDSDKERLAVGTAVNSDAGKSASSLPKAVGRNVQQTQSTRPVFRDNRQVSNDKSKSLGRSSGASSSSAARISKRRSELLLALDPSLGAPVSPGVPGGASFLKK